MMADLGKVLNGLEHCTSAKYPYPCNECVYRCNIDYTDPWSCRIAVMRDALELLNAQEPEKPEKRELPFGLYGAVRYEYKCGACGCGLMNNERWRTKFCPECGRKVKWDA